MKNENDIKQATSANVQEERKQTIKADRSVLYDHLDNKMLLPLPAAFRGVIRDKR